MPDTGHDERVARIRENLLKRHTQTDRETRVEFPEEAIAALKAMAAKLQDSEARAQDLDQRLAVIEAAMQALAAEAERKLRAA